MWLLSVSSIWRGPLRLGLRAAIPLLLWLAVMSRLVVLLERSSAMDDRDIEAKTELCADNLLDRPLPGRPCPREPIDAVYTWVNGSDPEFQQQLKEILAKLGVKTSKD